MKFEINNNTWKIEEIPSEELNNMYKGSVSNEDVLYTFGITIKPQQVIYINKDMCQEQKIRALKHELAHCYIWEYGLYNIDNINEETICDLVACSNDFINEVILKAKEDFL